MIDENIDILIKTSSDIRISDALGMYSANYLSILVENCGFSPRAYNCIKRNNCITLSDILELTFSELNRWRNLGYNTAQEIVGKCIQLKEKGIGRDGLSDILSSIISDLSKSIESKNNLEKIEFARKLIYLLPNDNKNKYIEKIEDYFSNIEELEDLDNNPTKYSIQEDLLDITAWPFAKSYSILTENNYIEGIIKKTDVFRDLLISPNIKENLSAWRDFFEWVNIDVDEELSYAVKLLDERGKDIIIKSYNGYTLDEIGTELNITRERVRQIRKNNLTKFSRYITHYNRKSLILWIYARKGNNNLIHQNDINELLSDENKMILWFAFKQGVLDSEGYWSYVPEYDAVYFDVMGKNSLKEAETIVNTFPDVLTTSELDDYVISSRDKFECDIKFILGEVEKQFIFYKEFYSRKKYNISDMCSYIMQTKFVDGYVISSEDDFKSFCNYLMNIFDYNTSDLTQHNLNGKISGCSYMIDKGVYKHISYLNVDEESCRQIRRYIDEQFESGRTAILYNEIYEKLKDRLSKDIVNFHIVHSLISTMPWGYKTAKDYVLKDIDSSFENDFSLYVKNNWPISIEKVANHFCCTYTQIQQLAERCSCVNVKGRMLLYKR